MDADISRDSFDPRLDFLRVISQQGRPVLDSETNEQTSILLHYLRTLAMDLIGPAGGPVNYCGFQITPEGPGKPTKSSKKSSPPTLWVGPGRYYVDGLICENHRPFPLHERIQIPNAAGFHLVYLDVWEQFCCVEDMPVIAEPALEGVSTTARSRVEWRILIAPCEENFGPDQWDAFVNDRHPPSKIRLRVRPSLGEHESSSLGAGEIYTGDSQVYHVELQSKDTFKWARDNASNVFGLIHREKNRVILKDVGHDHATGLAINDIVEIVDPHSGQPGSLHVIQQIVPAEGTFTLNPPAAVWPKNSYLRRWDHPGNAQSPSLELKEREWIDLEYGLSIWFEGADERQPGDYWLIAARPATGSSLWTKRDAEEGREPDGVHHHYAPLATVSIGATPTIKSHIRHFSPLAIP